MSELLFALGAGPGLSPWTTLFPKFLKNFKTEIPWTSLFSKIFKNFEINFFLNLKKFGNKTGPGLKLGPVHKANSSREWPFLSCVFEKQNKNRP